MMNNFNRFVVTTASMGLSLIVLEAVPVQAAQFNFSGVLDSGSLAGEQYEGTFSFDETLVTGTGVPFLQEFIPVSDLELMFLNTTFSETDGFSEPEVAFIGSELVGLSFNVPNANANDIEISFSFVPGFTNVTEAQFVYDSPSFPVGQGEGSGGLAFEETETVNVPEPSSLVASLVAFGWFFGRTWLKKNKLQKNQSV